MGWGHSSPLPIWRLSEVADAKGGEGKFRKSFMFPTDVPQPHTHFLSLLLSNWLRVDGGEERRSHLNWSIWAAHCKGWCGREMQFIWKNTVVFIFLNVIHGLQASVGLCQASFLWVGSSLAFGHFIKSLWIFKQWMALIFFKKLKQINTCSL